MADEQKPDPAEDNPVRPDWLPEKFKDEAALVKSYGELESRLGELSERAKQADALEENYNELAVRLEQVESQRNQATQVDPLIAQYNEAIETGDLQKYAAIQDRLTQYRIDQALAQATPKLQQQYDTLAQSQALEIGAYAARTMEQRYGDQWEQAKGAVGEILQANPHLFPDAGQTDPSAAIAALDNIYKIATYGAAPVQTDDGAAERAKLLAQTATGAGTRVLSPDEQKQEWDAIAAARPKNYWE